MSIKSQSVRKKAQDYVRKRDWLNAVKEYKRLVDIEQNNPNVFNELGDLHLKANQKAEAFSSYEQAIEAYQRVNLYNNAIAVCKKILRLNPKHCNVLFTLGQLRKAQGITKEAVSYFVTYIQRVSQDSAVDHEEEKKKLLSIVDLMPTHPEVLEEVSGALVQWEFVDDAGGVLSKLQKIYGTLGIQDKCDDIAKRLDEMGYQQPAEIEQESPLDSVDEAEVRSEGNLWDATPPSPGEQITKDLPGDDLKEAPSPPATAAPAAASGADYGNLDLNQPETEPQGDVGVEVIDAAEEPAADEETGTTEAGDFLTGPANLDGAKERPDDSEKNAVIVSDTEGPGSVVHVSKIIDEFKDEVQDAIGTEDFHTHYDLGMAYLEMDLHAEAIREFQMAAKAPEYQVSSLEMIGLCFIKQNQPRLAIKQLERGLELVGNNGREALGLLYTLGIAFEMDGDIKKAKEYFEDVYVVDVSFRDVAKKIESYT